MKLTTVLSALMVLPLSGNLFSFSTKAYNTYSSNLELHETSDIENGSYLNYDINLFIEINSHKIQFFSITRDYRFFNSTKENIEEEYYWSSHLIDTALGGPEIIYPIHSFP